MTTPVAATTENNAKRPRVAVRGEDSDDGRDVVDYLLSKLSLNDDDNEKKNSKNDKQQEKTSRKKELCLLEHDKQLVKALQQSLMDIEKRLQKKEVTVHQKYSIFNVVLDKDVRDHIVTFLDEEALWVLEESTMMQLDSEELNDKWYELYRKRKHPFPDVYCLEDEALWRAEDEVPQRWLGIYFGQASRMARCMEALAQDHYGTNFPTTTGTDQRMLHSWPTGKCKTLRKERLWRFYFVRISYNYSEDADDNNKKSPLVLEGFSRRTEDTIDSRPSHSEVILEMHEVEESVQDRLYEKLNQVSNEGFDPSDAGRYHERALEVKRRMGDQLAITILELGCINADRPNEKKKFDIRLVVSSTGYSYEDGEYLYLNPRSPDFLEKHQHNSADCIRVGFDLEMDQNTLEISLTG